MKVFVRLSKINLHGALEAQNPMNHRGRWRIGALASAVALLGCLASLEVHALSLGRITVQSALGEPLRGEIDITDMNPDEASSLKVGIASAETFKAAGLDYPSAATGLEIKLQRRSNGKPYLRLNSNRAITEPFVDLILEASWSSGSITRDYTMLFDPPSQHAGSTAVEPTAPMLPQPMTPDAGQPVREMAANPSENPTAPAAPDAEPPAREMAANPGENPVTPAVPDAEPHAREIVTSSSEQPSTSSEQPMAPVTRPAPVARSTVRRTTPVKATPDGDNQVTVKTGDTASKVAARNKPANVSLDQMLVALLRGNPGAFIGGNINTMKSGAVLDIPNTETASAISSAEARQIIVAQSKDFNAFRRKLAKDVSTTPVAKADRQVGGKLQADVEDRALTNTTPDKLTLTKGALQGKPAGTPEDKIVKNKEAQEASTRVTELSKNINDLSQLSAESASKAASVPAINVPAPSSLAVQPAASQASSAAATSSAPALSAASAASSDTAPTATIPASDASSAQDSLASASEPVVAATAPPEPVAIQQPAATEPPPAEPGLIDQMRDNAVPLLGGVGLLALLGGGFAFLRHRQQKKSKTGQLDSSFLESRLQPDSFFGASGGSRVNTSANNNITGSSMAYTPSQMDASGDVDPVAEADVYLAYGRDEQAEDILKEAMHTYPTRVAIHAKLLEIYAKRRDIKSFENLAREAFKLSQGQGPEWAEIIERGADLDPGNPLYHSSEATSDRDDQDDVSALAPSSAVARSNLAATPVANVPPSVNVDMDFSQDAAPKVSATPAASPAPLQSKAPQATSPATAIPPASTLDDLDLGLSFDLTSPPVAASAAPSAQTPEIDAIANGLDFTPAPFVAPKPIAAPTPATAAPAAHDDGMLEFNLDSLSLDLPSTVETLEAAPEEDPLEIKFLLAEEFRSLGDTDGARSLADEVLAKAKGPLKIKVQSFLNALS